jgi:DNA repair exonuclease SbcCD ATPase subunit
MAAIEFPAISAELAQLRERAEDACEDSRRLRHEQRAALERIRARMKTIRAKRAELRRFLRDLRSAGG